MNDSKCWVRAEAIVVYDTEFTTWPGAAKRNWSGPGEHRELVQIGAVLLDAERNERAFFSTLVTPTVNPVLSAYFTDLTGITDADVAAHGLPLGQALESFKAFCAPARAVCAFGIDSAVIEESCGLIGLSNPMSGVNFVNIRGALLKAAGIDLAQNVYSSALPLLFGLDAQPHAHDGLSDARAIATVLRHLRRTGDL